MGVFDAMSVSASGMTAQRLRMDTISQNIANVNTTRTESGEAYRRKTVVFQEINGGHNFRAHLDRSLSHANAASSAVRGGVKVSRVIEDGSPLTQVYDPTHPDANEEGYVEMPNVNVVEEMTNLISANRSYEANITAFNATKGMTSKALEIGR